MGLIDRLEKLRGPFAIGDSTRVVFTATEISSLLSLTRSAPASNQFIAETPSCVPGVGLVIARGMGRGRTGVPSSSTMPSSACVFKLFDRNRPPRNSGLLIRKPSSSIDTPRASVLTSRLGIRRKLLRFEAVPG